MASSCPILLPSTSTTSWPRHSLMFSAWNMPTFSPALQPVCSRLYPHGSRRHGSAVPGGRGNEVHAHPMREGQGARGRGGEELVGRGDEALGGYGGGDERGGLGEPAGGGGWPARGRGRGG